MGESIFELPAAKSPTKGTLSSARKAKGSLTGAGSGYSGRVAFGTPTAPGILNVYGVAKSNVQAGGNVPALNSGDDNEVETGEEEGLLVFTGADPIPAWKVGSLTASSDGQSLVIGSGTANHILSGDERAECNHGGGHKAPDLSCSCGFYCYRTVGELRKFGVLKTYGHKDQGQVLLSIDLKGRVIEHERLMRGEHQIIKCIYLPGECHDCDDEATKIIFLDNYPKTYCDSCVEAVGSKSLLAKSPVFTPGELRELTGGISVNFYNKPGW